MIKTYRSGALGALVDEYERAAIELADLTARISDADFLSIRDTRTQDEHCRSIQTVMSHVIHSGYGYANNIRKTLGIPFRPHELVPHARRECPGELHDMIGYTAETLHDRWHYGDDEIMAVRMSTSWGQQYDLEQLLEHAIVHILRHRRQIEKFLAAGLSAPSPG